MSCFINAVDKVYEQQASLNEALETFTKMSKDELLKFKGSLNDVMKANVILELKKENCVCHNAYGKTYNKMRKIITECNSTEVEDEYSDNKSG